MKDNTLVDTLIVWFPHDWPSRVILGVKKTREKEGWKHVIMIPRVPKKWRKK